MIGFEDGAVVPAAVSSSLEPWGRGRGGVGGAQAGGGRGVCAPTGGTEARKGRSDTRMGHGERREGTGPGQETYAFRGERGWEQSDRWVCELSSGYSHAQMCIEMSPPAGLCPSRFVLVHGS